MLGKANGAAFDNPVVVQVLLLPDAASSLHAAQQLLGNRATVETVTAVAGDGAQGIRQVGLGNQRAGLGRLIVTQKQPRGFGVTLHGGQSVADQRAVVLAAVEAVFCRLDGWGQ